MAMFDPVYVTEVLNDILSRKGLQLIMVPKVGVEHQAQKQEGKHTVPAEDSVLRDASSQN